jgi:glycosyltransferase involved in cell wall biosynthesis
MTVHECPHPGRLRVTHVIAGLTPEDGGPSYSVPALVASLQENGADARVRCVSKASAAGGSGGRELNISVHAARPGAFGRTLRASPSLARALYADAGAGGILHTHGLWLAPNLYPARVKRKSGGNVKLVHSPRGMLGPAALAISYWKKRAMWVLAQRAALNATDCLHATARSELEEIRQAGLTMPVAVIPNGVDLPELDDLRRPRGPGRLILSLGRIHPKKGLDSLLRAWSLVENEFPNWHLRIVGPAELRHDHELRALAGQLGLRRAAIEGPCYAEAKLALFRAADVFVLPTLNENFALTVAEALAAETPVISTKGAPWAGLERERCGWWIDHGVKPLAQALRTAMQMPPEQRFAMGARGRLWMARDFGWDRIGMDMLEVYRWLRFGGDRPATVQLD